MCYITPNYPNNIPFITEPWQTTTPWKFHMPEFSPKPENILVDIIEIDNSVIITANVAGANPDKIDLKIKNSILYISIEKYKNFETSFLKEEIPKGKFTRNIELPNYIDETKYKSSYKNGILTISFSVIKSKKSELILTIDSI